MGIVKSDGTDITSISEKSLTSTITWSNPSGTKLRITDVNSDQLISIGGFRLSL